MSMPTRSTELAELSAEIEQKTADFLANGGEIEQLPDNCSADTYNAFNRQSRKQAERRAQGLRTMQKANARRKRMAAAKRFTEKFPGEMPATERMIEQEKKAA